MIKDTLIAMSDGTQKPIQEVKAGDIILGYNFETGQPTPSVVLWAAPTALHQRGAYFTFSNGKTLGMFDKHTLYCVEFGSYLPIENWREGYHSLDIDGNEIEVMAIYWNIESREYNTYYDLYSSNNTYFANGILNARMPVEKQRRLKQLIGSDLPEDIESIVKEEAKDAGCMHFAVTNSEFITKSLPFQNKIKTSKNRIKDLEKLISDVNNIMSKVAAGLSIVLPDASLKSKYFTEIEELKNKIAIEEVKYNKLLAQYSDLGDDILLDEKERNKKYFQRAVKLANENFETYKEHYCKK